MFPSLTPPARLRLRIILPLPLPLLLLLLCFPTPLAAAATEVRRTGDEFFNPPAIHQIQVQIPAAELAKLQKDNRAYVACDVTVDGRPALRETGVHLKGHATFRGLNDRPCLTLNFGKFTDRQTLLGIRKLHLNNSLEDPSYLSEHLAAGLYAAAGVPATRVTFARVTLNGRDLGLYTAIEGLSKEFLRRYFTDVRGNLYDGGFCQDITTKKQQLLGTNATDQTDLRDLAQAAREPDLARRWERLGKLLDVEQFASYLAMEILSGNWDGYTFNLNNYRLYHHAAADKFIFIAHGMDDMFKQTRNPFRPENIKGLVAAGFLQTPEGRQRYETRVTALFTNAFQLAPLLAQVDALNAIVQPARGQPGTVTELRQRLTQHHRTLEKHFALAQTRPAVAVATPATLPAKLTGWKPEHDAGSPALDEVQLDGRATLHISTRGQPCVASWRTTVSLPPGRYRFTGQARTANVDPQTNDVGVGTGVGLRISGGKRTHQLTATTGWTTLDFPFEISDPAEVILVAELRANRGDAWFDPATFRLVRQ